MSVIFKCKMCGGDLDIKEGSTIAECLYCGRKQTLPKLDDDKRRNLYDRANYFRQNGDFDKAMTIYEQILSEDNTDAEAYWSLVLCRYGIEYVEDPLTHQRVPTVNRTQPVPVTSDEDYKQALHYADDYQTSIYEEEAKAIDEIQKGILKISRREKTFDVFICYKESDNNGQRTPDSVLAVDLYDQLTKEGFKVFCSRLTLEDKLGEKYEPYIFAALNSAPVMVALGTKPEYFNAVWVRNEWSRYLTLIKNGAKKTLIPAYRDMSPYDLPDEFAHLQAQDMSKLGFMQDLIRGVKKILEDKNSKTQTVNLTSGNPNAAPLLKRAFIFLEDRDFQKADEYSERVLDIDPENATAYLGKLMAELKVRKREDLANCLYSFESNKNYQKAIRFADEQLSAELDDYVKCVKKRIEIYRLISIINQLRDIRAINANTQLINAASFGRTKIVNALIDAEADINARDENGETALIKAAYFGRTEIVNALIDAGADINARDENGETALIKAAYFGKTKIVNALIDAGADINARDKYGKSAIMSLHYNVNEIIRALVKAGADINDRDENGETALMSAAFFGDTEIVNALIDAGADINAKDKLGKTALDYARDKKWKPENSDLNKDTLARLGASGCMIIIIEAFAIITALVAVGCLL